MSAIPLPASPPRAAVRRRVRAVVAWLHLWLGLGVGSVFAVLGLSGSVLVFHDDLVRWQHPALAAQDGRADGHVLARILDEHGPRGLASVQLPGPSMPAWTGFYADGRRAHFATDDGRLLLMRSEDDDALLWLHELHTHLLAGETGEPVLGVIGFTCIALMLGGLYLWWPKRGRVRAQLRVFAAPPIRRWLTWHRSAGVVMLPLLLLATLTGVGMVYHDAARGLLTAAFGGGAAPAPPVRAGDGPVDWPRVLDTAARALPDARLTRTSAPKDGQDVVAFRARTAGEWHPNGRTTVALDRGGRVVLQTHDATTQRAGARMAEAIYPLHIGSVGGAPVRWLTAFAGLVPAFLLVSGFLFWRRRRGR